MAPSDSDTDRFASALHRGILGALLAILALLGLGWARRLLAGDLLWGALGLLLFLGAGYWIVALFREGLAER